MIIMIVKNDDHGFRTKTNKYYITSSDRVYLVFTTFRLSF